MASVPSVTTIGGTLEEPDDKPVQRAERKADSDRDGIRTPTGTPGCAAFSMATAIPLKHRFDAIDRSSDRDTITAIWPSASMMRSEVSLKTCTRFAGLMKSGNRMATEREQRKIRE